MSLARVLGAIGSAFGVFEGVNLVMAAASAMSRTSSPPDPNALPKRTLIVVPVRENGTNLDNILDRIQAQSAYRTLPHHFNIVFNIGAGVEFIATNSELTSYGTMGQRNIKPLISVSQGLSLESAIDQYLDRGHELVVIVDAKAELGQHWLGSHFKHYDDPNVIAVSGPVLSQLGPGLLVEGFANHVRKPNLDNLSFRSSYFRAVKRRMDDPSGVFKSLREMGRVVWDQSVGFRRSNGTPTSTSSPSADLRTQVAEVADLLEAVDLDDSTMLSYTRRLNVVLGRIES